MQDGTGWLIQPGETIEASFLAAGFEGSEEVIGISSDRRVSQR